MRLLIDHCTAHVLLMPFEENRVYNSLRGTLQFIEELCLASEIWLTDTEGTETLASTREVFDRLIDHQLAASDQSGLVRFATVSHQQLLAATTRAADRLHEHVSWLQMNRDTAANFRNTARRQAAPIHPLGIQARDFPAFLSGITWESSTRETVIDTGLRKKEFGSTAAILLLNKSLLRWAQSFVHDNPDPADLAYETLNTLCRWYINTELAQIVGNGVQDAVQHAPAYGRALSVADKFLPPAVARLNSMSSRLWDICVLGSGNQDPLSDTVGLSLPLPPIGAAVLLSLPQKATVDDLFSRVKELREEPEGKALRDLMSERRSAVDIEATIIRLQKRVRSKGKLPATLKLRTMLTTTPPWGKIEIVAERDLSTYSQAGVKSVLKYLINRPNILMFTSFLEPLFRERALMAEIQHRVRSILAR